MNYDIEMDDLKLKNLEKDSDEKVNFQAIYDSLQKIQAILYDIENRLESGGH